MKSIYVRHAVVDQKQLVHFCLALIHKLDSLFYGVYNFAAAKSRITTITKLLHLVPDHNDVN